MADTSRRGCRQCRIGVVTIADLRRRYHGGERPEDVVRDIFGRIRSEGKRPIWISLADEGEAIERARSVDLSLPLGGIPFAVKDSIDIAGMPTTVACPAFSYEPATTAPVVQRLLDAGAILIGKTNLDQFATGLVGVRSPYGACRNVFDPRYIAGGSSSGSAVATARGLCAFALATDTAGSGRVPAAFNNLVGIKPTLGLLSTTGLVPACRSLDCITVLSTTVADGDLVWRLAQGFDASNPYSRRFEPGMVPRRGCRDRFDSACPILRSSSSSVTRRRRCCSMPPLRDSNPPVV